MHISTPMTAGQRIEFVEQSNFFRILDLAGFVNIEFYKNGGKVSEAIGITAGYAERFSDSFDKIAITSATAQTIQFVTRLGNEVRYDKAPVGNTTINNVASTFTNTQKTVTNASGTIVAANANRRYLLIQNNDASGDIYVRLDGVTATTETGLKIEAGASYELANLVPNGAITAIGSIASNANIVVVEA
jgi:hypothetical protein